MARTDTYTESQVRSMIKQQLFETTVKESSKAIKLDMKRTVFKKVTFH